MIEPAEQSMAKIDGVIADIRMINLHFHLYLTEKCTSDFRKLNVAHFQEHYKRVSEYLKKSFRELQRVKVTLSPLCFRFFRPKYKQEGFLRFENENFGVKFILTDLEREALLQIELYRKMKGGRLSGLAFRKLQTSFLYDVSVKYSDGVVWYESLEQQGKIILQELTIIMAGQVCDVCRKHLAFNQDHSVYLPPTVRETVEGREGKKTKLYYHQSCL